MFAYGAALFFEIPGRGPRIGWLVFASMGTLAILLASGRQGLVIWIISAAVVLWIHRRRLLLFFIGQSCINNKYPFKTNRFGLKRGYTGTNRQKKSDAGTYDMCFIKPHVLQTIMVKT